tara:strand:- start:1894 stop:3993 length:2100 start_codon:yes stop_codon:yes gene_type:complete
MDSKEIRLFSNNQFIFKNHQLLKAVTQSFTLICTLFVLSACGGSSGASNEPEPTYTIGGSISGLTDGSLTIRNNGSDNLTIESNGAFKFNDTLLLNEQYEVTIQTQPDFPGLSCNITNSIGTVAQNENVNSVSIECSQKSLLLNIAYDIKQLKFNWLPIDKADHYLIYENPDELSGYTQISSELTSYEFDLEIASYLRTNASYIISACNPLGCYDSSATYPATLSDAIGYFKSSNTTFNQYFGTDVAFSDDGKTLVVSARGEDSDATGINGDQNNRNKLGSGAAYVFANNDGVWSQQAYLKPSNTDDQDAFGNSITLSGDGNTLAISSLDDSNASGINGDQTNNSAQSSGAVYVFERANNTWRQQAYIKASNSERNDNFGSSLSLSTDGNTLAIGAESEDSNSIGINEDQSNNDALQSGAVYIFERINQTWTQHSYVKASNTDSNDKFGNDLSLSGDGHTLAIGAYSERSNSTGINSDQTNNNAYSSGAVYIFHKSNNVWSQEAYLKASNAEAGDFFGQSLTISEDGNILATSAYQESSNAIGVNGNEGNNDAANAGAVYIFQRASGVWTQEAYLKSSNTEANDQFGHDLSLSKNGEILAVSSFQEDSESRGIEGDQTNNVDINSGAVYVFINKDQAWSQLAYIKASNTDSNDHFGVSISLAGDGNTLAVGADLEDGWESGIGGSQTNLMGETGAVYLY